MDALKVLDFVFILLWILSSIIVIFILLSIFFLITHTFRFNKFIEQLKSTSNNSVLYDKLTNKSSFKQRLFDYHKVCLSNNSIPNSEHISSLVFSPYEFCLIASSKIINLLPILGLVGTFIGVVIAINNLSLSSFEQGQSVIDSLETNLSQLPYFLDGIKLAFKSSAYALGIAFGFRLLLFTPIDIIGQHRQNMVTETLNVNYEPFFSAQTSEEKTIKALNRYSEQIQENTKSFQSAIEELYVNFSDYQNQYKDDFETMVNKYSASTANFIVNSRSLESIFDLHSNNISNLIKSYNELNKQNYSMAESLKSIMTDNQNMIERQESLIDSVDKKNEAISEKIKDEFDKQMENAERDQQILVEKAKQGQLEIKQKFELLSDEISSNFEPIKNLVNSFGDYNEEISSLNNELISYKENFKKVIEEFKNDISKTFEKSHSDNEHIKKILPEIVRIFNNIETLQSNQDSIVKQSNGIIEKFNEPLTQLKSSIESFYTASSNLASGVNQKMESLFNDLRQRDDLTVNNLYLETKLFEDFEKVLEEQKQVMSIIHSEVKKLNSIIDGFTIFKLFRKRVNGEKNSQG